MYTTKSGNVALTNTTDGSKSRPWYMYPISTPALVAASTSPTRSYTESRGNDTTAPVTLPSLPWPRDLFLQESGHE